MGKVINLQQARKARARAEKAARGDENAVRHGRTRAQKAAEKAAADKAKRDLDGHETE
ncbi:MAG: DUF4169 family protein [Pseudomonadota bacterium]